MLKISTKDLKVRLKMSNATGNDVIVTICKLYEVLIEQGFKKKDIDKYLNDLLKLGNDDKGGEK